MSSTNIRIATRTSSLALWQAKYIADCLRVSRDAPTVELIHIRTRGDGDQASPLREFGGTGAFTREVQRAVLEGEADVAVHSLKDLPTQSVEGLSLACVPGRASRFDAVVLPRGQKPLSSISDFPAGAVIGTGSPRRRAQLLYCRPDLTVRDIRGNVDTRVRKLDAGDYDAVILAEAGLQRLGLQERISLVLSPPQMLPAVGQGALGVECRVDDSASLKQVLPLTDVATLQSVTAERSLLRALGAGCHAPLGAWTEIDGRQLTLRGVLLSADGSIRLEAAETGNHSDAEQIGCSLAQQLFEAGGHALLLAD